jgi:hypothetical protein
VAVIDATFRPARARALLFAGLAAGIALAAVGISSQRTAPPLPADAMARVNGRVIRDADFQAALNDAALLAGATSPSDAAGRRQVLDGMIEEELLVQRALDLGLAQRDGRVRRELAAAVVTSVVLTANATEPDVAELRAYYEANRAHFAQQVVVRVAQVWLGVTNLRSETQSYEKAKEAERRWRLGDDVVTIRSDVGDAEPVPIPDRPMLPGELARYLDPICVNVVLSLAAGKISQPIRSLTGFHVLKVVARWTGGSASFEQALPVVESEYRQERANRALVDYVKELRRGAAIEVRPDAP